MNPLEIIVGLTLLIEAGLAMALIYRATESESKDETRPPFKVHSKKFYRSRQRPDGTWEIG